MRGSFIWIIGVIPLSKYNIAFFIHDKLAERCSFSNTMLSNYETGKNKPSLTTLAKIAKQLSHAFFLFEA
jgi:transcriptional regulator with XRE-family HTH domain